MKKLLLTLAAAFSASAFSYAQTAAEKIGGTYTGDLYVSVGEAITDETQPLVDQEIAITAETSGTTVALSLANFSFGGLPVGDIFIPGVPVAEQADGSVIFEENPEVNLSFLEGQILATAKVNEAASIYADGQLTANLDVVWTNTFDGVPCPIYVRFVSTEKTSGIGDIELDATAPVAVYTLSGTRVSTSSTQQLPKGVYIVNGKKTLIK